jgi:hypothetical protein
VNIAKIKPETKVKQLKKALLLKKKLETEELEDEKILNSNKQKASKFDTL